MIQSIIIFTYNQGYTTLNQQVCRANDYFQQPVIVFGIDEHLLPQKKIQQATGNKSIPIKYHKIYNRILFSQTINIYCQENYFSAFIERFFSIPGMVCQKRSTQMTDILILMRSVHKVKMYSLKRIYKTRFIDDGSTGLSIIKIFTGSYVSINE